MEIMRAPNGMAYTVFGEGKIDVIIEMGLGACMAEWWHVADMLANSSTVLLYERSGINCSKPKAVERSPANIALELKELLQYLPCEEQVTLIAHSQGGLYAQQFARMYASNVKSIILLDPLTAKDHIFAEELSPEEYKKSGADKSSNLKYLYWMARLRLGFIIRGMMRNAPPFYYYNFTKEATDYIFHNMTSPTSIQTAMKEYQHAHTPNFLVGLDSPKGFPDIPLTVITHTSELAIKETMEYGNTSRELAEKVEKLWQELMLEYLSFSVNAKHIQAKHSSHYIHLSEPDLICNALVDFTY